MYYLAFCKTQRKNDDFSQSWIWDILFPICPQGWALCSHALHELLNYILEKNVFMGHYQAPESILFPTCIQIQQRACCISVI